MEEIYDCTHLRKPHTVSRCHRPLNSHCVLVSSSHVDSESISLKNLKRRSEFFEKGKKEEKEKKKGGIPPSCPSGGWVSLLLCC